MPGPVVDILMYHSISDRGGATAIQPAVFSEQMRALAESEVPVVTLDDLAAAHDGRGKLPPRSVIITFDDGFRDFIQTAWPVMRGHGFRPMVYLPTAFVGRDEGWHGIAMPPRALMSWAEISLLSREGVDFGSHTVSHPNLDALPEDALIAELDRSKRTIEDRLGKPIRHFAPPYGLAGAAVRARIAQRYRTSVGTVLAQARSSSDLHDLPRVEMFYFRDIGRWRAHLAGRGALYLRQRQAARWVKSRMMRPWAGL